MLHRRQTLALILAAAAPVPAWAAGADAAGHRLVRRGDRLFLAATVNGTAVEALLDSAAETSLMDPRFAARLGLGGGTAANVVGSGASESEARLIPHVRIAAAGVSVSDATVAVVDLGDIGKRLIGAPLDFIVGRELFDAGPLAIDIAGGTIAAAEPSQARPGVALPLTERYGIEEVPVSIEGHAPTGAAFDLGNGSGVLVARAYADHIGLLKDHPATAVQGGGLGGARPRQRVVLKSLTLAGHTFPDVPADIDEAKNSSDVNIGVGILQHFRIVTDFPAHRVWLEGV